MEPLFSRKALQLLYYLQHLLSTPLPTWLLTPICGNSGSMVLICWCAV
jgi:hypothetical protein